MISRKFRVLEGMGDLLIAGIFAGGAIALPEAVEAFGLGALLFVLFAVYEFYRAASGITKEKARVCQLEESIDTLGGDCPRDRKPES